RFRGIRRLSDAVGHDQQLIAGRKLDPSGRVRDSVDQTERRAAQRAKRLDLARGPAQQRPPMAGAGIAQFAPFRLERGGTNIADALLRQSAAFTRRTAPAGSRNSVSASGRAAIPRISECVRAMNSAAPAPLCDTSPSTRTRSLLSTSK